MACYYETRVKPIINCLLLQFGVDSICGQKNALHIKFVSSDSSLEENSQGRRHAHLSRKKLFAG